MDFLNRATEKLDVKDKLPDQVKDKIPGSSKSAKGQGEHLTSKNNDPGGFPKGLKPESWMGDLVSSNKVPETALVTEFRYPGSHDCATYKDGAASFSYQCQDKNLYDQMKTGQRMFDLRMAQKEGAKNFIPVHGIAKGTGDDFSQSEKEAKPNDICSQIMKFAKEHKTEILVFSTRVEELPKVKKEFMDTLWNLLGERLLEAPSGNQQPPTYQQAVQSNRNIIFGLPGTLEGHPAEKYIWTVGNATPCWMGASNEKLWNEPTWQSGELKKVLASTESYINENERQTAKRNRFWVANLQLTPVLGQNITTFFKEGGSIRPRDLALGGGMGTHGSFKGSNKELRESGVLNKPLWTKNASCIIYDFCDLSTTGDIVEMNIAGDFSGGSAGAASGAGPAATRDIGETKHGKKGGAGKDDDDDDDGPKRGGHGKGRGGHGGGRGGHD